MSRFADSRLDLPIEWFRSSSALEHSNHHAPVHAGDARVHQRVILVVGSQMVPQLRHRVNTTGYSVAEYAPDDLPFGPKLVEFEAIVVPASLRTLDSVFKTVHRVNEWRFSPAIVSLPPELVLVAVTRLPAGTVADLRNQCCRVVYDTPGQLSDELEVIVIERKRLRDKGVLLLVVEVAGSMPIVFLVGANGRQTQMDLNAREVRLLRKLGSERRAFDPRDLAGAIGCKPDQVKVYIERLKSEYDIRRKEVGNLLGTNELIKNPGRGFGYQLHARFKTIGP